MPSTHKPSTTNGGTTKRGGLGTLKIAHALGRSFALRPKRGNALDTGSLHSRRRDDSNNPTSSSTAADTVSIWKDPQLHLDNLITEQWAPFLYPLVRESKIPPVLPLSRDQVRVGKLLREGSFCQWHRAKLLVDATSTSNLQRRIRKNNTTTKSNRNKERYIIKHLHPKFFPENSQRIDNSSNHTHNNNNNNTNRTAEKDLERAATRMVIEGLYLAYLDHDFIAELRGFSMGGLSALQSTGRQDSLFLLLDPMSETLDKRMEKWKAMAHKRRKAASPYPAPLVPTVHVGKSSKSVDPTLQTYPEDLVALKTNYALQILHALDYLHERGIVLRELRPESIAFLEYPHHHTVQLCDLSSCIEIPRDQEYLPVEACQQQKQKQQQQQQQQHNLHHDHSTSSDDSHQSEMLFGVKANVGIKRYMAPELFPSSLDTSSDQPQQQQGYSTKVDIYSWSMIVVELLTDSKPYSSRQIYDEWQRIESGKLRPVLKKHNFPRSLQGVIESAWHHDSEKRPTAKTLEKQVSVILNMLEGNGLPWSNTRQSSNNTATNHQQTDSKEESFQSLPDRAAEYVHMGDHASQSWSQVWNQDDSHSGRNSSISSLEYQAELDASRERARQRIFKHDKTSNVGR